MKKYYGDAIDWYFDRINEIEKQGFSFIYFKLDISIDKLCLYNFFR